MAAHEASSDEISVKIGEAPEGKLVQEGSWTDSFEVRSFESY